MDVSYKKEFRYNYLLIPKLEGSDDEAYSVSMLEANPIAGITKPEPRTIDNKVLYYYDITSRQAFETIYIKNTINYNQLKGLFTDFTWLINQAYEYLLNENDLVFRPEYIYMDLATGRANVVYLPGYNKDIGVQMSSLVEYLMNKVEYNDKEAVIYIYNLYAACQAEGFSLNNLFSVISEGKPDKVEQTVSKRGLSEEIETKAKNNCKKDDNTGYNLSEVQSDKDKTNKHIPVMMEKIRDDREEYYYPLRAYIYTGACTLGAILVLIISINMRFIYTSVGNRVDYGKLMALLLILIIIVGYLIKNIWSKNNRLTRIISRQEYIDPRIDYKVQAHMDDKLEPMNAVFECEPADKNKEDLNKRKNIANETVLLNKESLLNSCRLEPENKDSYNMIHIREFPFIIGKLENNVDYCLNNEVVSRYHTKITKEEDKYYITDLNSTNGTTLNEKSLACYQRNELLNDDQIAIADIKYTFKAP